MATSTTASSTIVYQTINQPVIERIIERTALTAAPSGYVTQDAFTTAINELSDRFGRIISGSTYPMPAATFASGGVWNAVALTNRIDQLSGTSLFNVTVSGVSGLTDADIPDSITASNYLPLSGGSLTFASSTRFSVFDMAYFGGTSTTTIDSTGAITVTSTSANTFPYASTTALTTSGTGFFGGLNVNEILLASGASTNSFIVNAGANSIEAAASVSTISGGGRTDAPNIIGTTTLPRFNDFTPTDWAADTGYVSGSADVALISGGYDNIVNQLAGTIVGGGHNFLKYSSQGHSIIGGGSYNLISASRSGIFSGRRNTITGSKVFSFIGGGDDNNIVGDYSTISGGLSNVVTGNYSTVLGGDLNTVTGNYSLSFGRRAKASASGVVALSDSTNADFEVTTANMFAARFSGGYYFSGGNVGIGTASANRKLELSQTDSSNALLRLASAPSSSGTSYESALEFYAAPTNVTTVSHQISPAQATPVLFLDCKTLPLAARLWTQ